MTIRAIYRDGVFKPTEPVNLPEGAEAEVVLSAVPAPDESLSAIYKVMGESYASGDPDDAEQHNEHPTADARSQQADEEIFQVLSRRYNTGQTDTAERHNEH